MASQVDTYLERYRFFVIKNPLVASEIEVGLKWMSYIAAGRFTNSPVITELIHSVSNLLTLFNDNILRKAANIPVYADNVEKLQNFLAVIEYSEVFAEVAAYRLVGKRGRWVVIVILQIIKSMIRLMLVLKYNVGIQYSPPIPTLNRKVDIPELCNSNKSAEFNGSPQNVEVTFTLKRSGRIVRTLDAAPPLVSRSWKLPKVPESNIRLCYKNPSKLSSKQLAGEVLHVCRPLAHLLSMGRFGEFSWKPWLIAFGIDVASFHLLRNGNFNRGEKLEVSRRALSLIVYLLRSPFYNYYSKIHILNSLKAIADNVPGSGILLRPVIEYIPEWQQIYFYTWAL